MKCLKRLDDEKDLFGAMFADIFLNVFGGRDPKRYPQLKEKKPAAAAEGPGSSSTGSKRTDRP